ncbi:MAG: hypothetical protein E3J72_10175 [Planctomycetota bacterium]|nr:MAG: hypothetical protein E3J72_10175 [Planctomycetota bacterium]
MFPFFLVSLFPYFLVSLFPYFLISFPVLETRNSTLGTWFLVLGSWFLVLGTWYSVLGTWYSIFFSVAYHIQASPVNINSTYFDDKSPAVLSFTYNEKPPSFALYIIPFIT